MKVDRAGVLADYQIEAKVLLMSERFIPKKV
jgi:hypothetical protein